MKKILALFVTTILIGNSYAQDEKHFHAGLKIDPMLSWLRPDDKKNFENDGVGMKFGMGLVLDFGVSDNFWISTGVGINFDGGSINYLESAADTVGYFYLDNEIVELNQDNGQTTIDTTATAGADFIHLSNRKFRTTYVNIPFLFKMKTKEIGMLKYFGQFGVNIGIKTKGRTDDTGVALWATNQPDLSDINIDSEMSLVRAQIAFGGGAEYNLSGSTSLLMGLTFNYGVTNVVNKNTEHLIQEPLTVGSGTWTAYNKQKFLPFNTTLTLGILF